MSETYRALTRKYRPATFKDIVSQEHVSNTLKNAIKQNRLSHAYLFAGPRGVGKTTMARVLARTINNLDQQVDGEQLNRTLNVVEIDAASNNKVEDVHHLRESVRIPPQNGRYKVFIIDEVHMLSTSAFNALLKTLEEPPDHAIFIFATTEPHKVLPTILSRVQRFDFKRITVDSMIERLKLIADKEQISIDDKSLHVIAKKADGALRDALGLMDQAIAFCGTDIKHTELLRALNVVSVDRLFQFMKHVEQQNAEAGLALVNDLMHEGYDIQEFLVELTEHLRNLYIAHSGENIELIEAPRETKKQYGEAARQFSKEDIMRMLHIVSEAQFKIREAHQPRIQFEITLLKLIHMSRSQQLGELIRELKSVKKKPLTSIASGTESRKNNPPENQPAISDTDIPADKTETGEAVGQNAPLPATEETDAASDPLDKFFGPPSLATGSETAFPSESAVSEETQKDRPPQKTSEVPKIEYLHELKEIWPEYLRELKNHVPKMLYLQMQRITPVDLQNRVVTLQCRDAFAQRMIDEHKTLLTRILKQISGQQLRLEIKIKEEQHKSSETMSPYERFKQLQVKDPKIRTIVELFGAELDY